MNWSKIVLSGVIAGVVGWLYDFAMHGFIMADVYVSRPEVFSQEQANPLHFLLVSVAVWLTIAALFGRTRGSWQPGFKGGATYGAFVGLVSFFPNFFHALVIADFPYFLSWCWGGIGLLGGVIGGAVIGAIYKQA